MKQYKTSAQLKGQAREHLFGYYGSAIGAYLIMNLIIGAFTSIVTAVLPGGIVGGIIECVIYIILLLVSGIFTAGGTYLYLNISCGNPVKADYIFYGFRHMPDKAIKLQLQLLIRYFITSIPLFVFLVFYLILEAPVLIVFIGLGAVIMIVGLVYLALLYMPAFYMLHDFPGYDIKQILDTSVKVMRGNVGRAFYIYVSFIPLQLVSLLSLGIASLWVDAYLNAVFAEFYLDLMKAE